MCVYVHTRKSCGVWRRRRQNSRRLARAHVWRAAYYLHTNVYVGRMHTHTYTFTKRLRRRRSREEGGSAAGRVRKSTGNRTLVSSRSLEMFWCRFWIGAKCSRFVRLYLRKERLSEGPHCIKISSTRLSLSHIARNSSTHLKYNTQNTMGARQIAGICYLSTRFATQSVTWLFIWHWFTITRVFGERIAPKMCVIKSLVWV
jgi:hypothetical protein